MGGRPRGLGAAALVGDQRYIQARFHIKPGEALIGRWEVPVNSIYWGVTLYNNAYQLLNCYNRQVNLNHALARVGADRAFHFVISHQDPGVANWLDVDGHQEGVAMIRVRGGTNVEPPKLEKVSIDSLPSRLGSEFATVTQDERKSNLANRRRHYQRREDR